MVYITIYCYNYFLLLCNKHKTSTSFIKNLNEKLVIKSFFIYLFVYYNSIYKNNNVINIYINNNDIIYTYIIYIFKLEFT